LPASDLTLRIRRRPHERISALMSSHAPVSIVPYDSTWPQQAAAEAVAILGAAHGLMPIVEHIGSTAVPNLPAKPIIDLLGGVARLVDAEAAVPALAPLGYVYVPEYEAQIPDRRYFRKGPDGARTHHLHVCVQGGEFWQRHLAFRDALRADPSLATAYERLKRDLARSCGPDRERYTEGKTEFVRQTVVAWRGSHP
jgi:GrpB-like predicted nucleotidyltransferase (UPF0157 family)